MKRLDDIIDSVGMSLSKLPEMVKVCRATDPGFAKSWTEMSD